MHQIIWLWKESEIIVTVLPWDRFIKHIEFTFESMQLVELYSSCYYHVDGLRLMLIARCDWDWWI